MRPFPVLLSFLLAALTSTGAARAQERDPESPPPPPKDLVERARDDDPDRRLAVYVNPLALAVGALGAEVDLATSRHVAIDLEAARYDTEGARAIAIGAGVVFFPTREVFEGLVVHPSFAYARATGGVNVASGGASVGYSWTWDAGFSLRLAGGAAYFAAESDVVALRGLRPVADADFGWTF